MLDTTFFQMLILIFKVFFYSADMDQAEIDLLEEGQYQMTFSYRQEAYRLTIVPVIDGQRNEEEAFYVDTIDNALYEVSLSSGDSFTVDMAPMYQALDWDGLQIETMEVPGEYGDGFLLSSGAENIYLADTAGRLLVLNRRFLLSN